jgi:hypothetical protein
VQELNLSNLVELRYYEEAAALYARWPNNDRFMPRDFQYTFTLLMDTIEKFKAKKLIIDSGSNYNNLSEADYRYISELLFSGLMYAGIEKVARIFSPFAGIEENFKKHNQQVRNEMGAGFELQNFAYLESALFWLKAESKS